MALNSSIGNYIKKNWEEFDEDEIVSEIRESRKIVPNSEIMEKVKRLIANGKAKAKERKDTEDWELVCAARESIKEHGTISWEDIKRELEEDGLKKKAKPIKKEDIGDWLRPLLD